MHDLFGAPIQHDRLYEQVAARIRDLIIKESIQAGDRLPGERQLAERLGVSRIVIREAIKVLNVQGLVDIRPGKGTFIAELDADHIVESLSLFLKMQRVSNSYEKLLEVRRTLEVEVAGFAAERANEKDYETLQATIEAMEKSTHDPVEYARHDLAFHAALAVATHNEIYSILLEPIADLSMDFRVMTIQSRPEDAIPGGLAHHKNILEKVRNGDVHGAREAMRDHLRQAQAVFEAARRGSN